MKCPECKKEIVNVNIISECWQKGIVDKKGNITDFGKLEEILATVKVEHRDNNCLADLTNIINE